MTAPVSVTATPRCRICGCTPDDPCQLGGGETCAWLTAARNVCTRISCVIAWGNEQRRMHREGALKIAELVLPIRQKTIAANSERYLRRYGKGRRRKGAA